MLLVKQCSSVFDSFISKQIAELGITMSEAHTLMFLTDNPELDSAFHIVSNGPPISKSYVSKAVSSLASKNLITLSRDESDRRIQHIKLTDEAKPIVKILGDARDRFINYLVGETTDDEKEILISVMLKIEERVQKLKRFYQ